LLVASDGERLSAKDLQSLRTIACKTREAQEYEQEGQS